MTGRPTRFPRSFVSIVLVFACGLTGLMGMHAALAGGADINDSVARIVSRMDRRDADSIWSDVRRLRDLGDPAVPAIKKAMKDAEPSGQLGCAGALMSLGHESAAADALLSLVWNAPDRAIRIQAVRVLSKGVQDNDLRTKVAKQMIDRLEEVYSPAEKIALAKGLWSVSGEHRVRAKDILRDILKSEDPGYRLDAALALAELGEPYSARAVLREFKDDPTPRGELARAYYENLELQTRIESLNNRLRGSNNSRKGGLSLPRNETSLYNELAREIRNRLSEDGNLKLWTTAAVRNLEDHEFLEEIVNKVMRHHIGDVDRETLMNAAARGILDALDIHSTFFTGEELDRWSFDLDPSYAGIGAYVNIVDDRFVIVRPIYSGPAYSLGLRTGDWIQEVDGWPTLQKPVEEITRRLKGLPGTSVEIKIARKGWEEPRVFEITRDNIEIPTARGEMLPGDIGYVRLDSFGGETAAELEEAMQNLERQGMKALVLDLRNNSGGYLATARKVVDKFLPAGKLICECKGVDDEPVYDSEGKYQYFTTDNLHHEEIPMVVLVNGASASASEIVAGALQEHGRATIIGTRSFGKGSVQNMFPLQTRPSEPHLDDARENGIWDEGEQYTDSNRNGRYDYGESWVDVPRRNRRWDPGESFEDRNGNGKWDSSEAYTDSNRNGRYDAPETFTDLDQNGKWDRGPHVKITLARYFLPNGRSIHREMDREGRVLNEGGVVPDVEQKFETLPNWILEEFDRLRDSPDLAAYVDGIVAATRELALELAQYDGFDSSRYPAYDDFVTEIDSPLPAPEMRRLVRMAVRRRVQDELGREFIQDVQEDTQLQRAIHHLADSIRLNLTDHPTLSHIPERFADAGTKAETERLVKDERAGGNDAK